MILKTLFGKKDANSSRPQNLEDSENHVPAKAVLTSDESLKTQTQEINDGQKSAPNQNIDEPPVAELLEKAMINNARADTAESRLQVYQELLFSEILLVLADKEGEAATSSEPKQQPSSEISVAILTNPSGVPFSAAFTSAAAARRWRPEGGQYISMRGQDVFKLLEESPGEVIVINPGSAPFIVLPKNEYKQLALGVMPQGTSTPVHVAVGEPKASESSEDATDDASGQVQISFPPDIFSEEQKTAAREILESLSNIEAAVFGAILPPGSDKNSGWVRTMFLRVSGIEENSESMQAYCQSTREKITANNTLFQNTGFEVGVMPDPSFWLAMHQNSIILFDKNPPELPQKSQAGVVEADLS